MPIEQIRITDRAQWLTLRKSDITASVAGALLGVHEYNTPYGLWALKTEQITEETEESPAMRRGRLLEPVAIQLIREERPGWGIKANQFYYRDPECRLGGTPDALATDPERPGFGIVQIKSVERSIFRQKWRNEDGEVEPPMWIVVQAIVEAHLTGAKWATVAALVLGHGIDIEFVEIPLHDGILKRLRDAVADFWQAVEENRPPNPDFAKDGELIERLFRDATDQEPVDLTGDNELPALLDERQQLSTVKNDAEKRLKEIKAELLFKLGTHVFGRCADGRLITAKTVYRKGYTVEPSSYRDLRIKAAS
jgi:predicted phage-related endonuclease